MIFYHTQDTLYLVSNSIFYPKHVDISNTNTSYVSSAKPDPTYALAPGQNSYPDLAPGQNSYPTQNNGNSHYDRITHDNELRAQSPEKTHLDEVKWRRDGFNELEETLPPPNFTISLNDLEKTAEQL